MNEEVYLNNKRNRQFGRRKRILSSFKLPMESKILDLGCGAGFDLQGFNLLGYKNLFGMDVSLNLLKHVKRFPVFAGDAHNLALKNDCFDAVFGSAIFHHLNFEKSFREIKRILKPKGVLCFKEPRNTIWRNSLTILAFSPLSYLVPWLKRRKDGMIEEFDDMHRWLRSEKKVFRELKNVGFKIVFVKRTMFSLIVKARLQN